MCRISPVCSKKKIRSHHYYKGHIPKKVTFIIQLICIFIEVCTLFNLFIVPYLSMYVVICSSFLLGNARPIFPFYVHVQMNILYSERKRTLFQDACFFYKIIVIILLYCIKLALHCMNNGRFLRSQLTLVVSHFLSEFQPLKNVMNWIENLFWSVAPTADVSMPTAVSAAVRIQCLKAGVPTSM